MGSFDAHKWFKKQYLEEGHTEDKTREIDRARIEAALEKEPQWEKDSETAEKIRAMLAKERSLKEDDIEENRLYPEAAYFDNIIKLIKSETMKHGGSEIDEAMDVMKFIGQHYGINFEFGRG